MSTTASPPHGSRPTGVVGARGDNDGIARLKPIDAVGGGLDSQSQKQFNTDKESSVTTCQPDSAVRAGESQKSQNRQYGDKQKRNHEDLPSPHFNPQHCRRFDSERHFSRAVKCPYRMPKPARCNALICGASFFAREALEPSLR